MTQAASVELDASGVAFIVYSADEAGQVHRDAREPGADLSDLPPDLQAQVAAVWTPDFVAAWQAQHHPAPTLADVLAEFTDAVDAQQATIRARGHLFNSGPLSGKRLAVRVGTEDPVNWLTLFTFAKDECDLSRGSEVYPGPLTAADGTSVTGLTWQDVLDAMRELRQFGLAIIGNAVVLITAAAQCGTVADAQALDPTTGWPA